MIRIDSLGPLNKAIRAGLYDTAMSVQQADLSDKQQATKICDSILELFNLVDDQKRFYERLFFCTSEFINPLTQKELVRLRGKVNDVINNFKSMFLVEDGDKDLRVWKLAILAGNFQQFMELLVTVLNEVEIKIHEVLTTTLKKVDILLLLRVITSAFDKQQLVRQLKWIVRGCNNKEITTWLLNIKETVNTDQFLEYLELTEKELPPGRWLAIIDSLADGKLHAS